MSIVERAVEAEEKWTLAQVGAAVKRLDRPAVSEAAEIIRAYDASYVWLSRILGAELMTLDRQLAKAASAPT
jgi:hypothetical protein